MERCWFFCQASPVVLGSTSFVQKIILLVANHAEEKPASNYYVCAMKPEPTDEVIQERAVLLLSKHPSQLGIALINGAPELARTLAEECGITPGRAGQYLMRASVLIGKDLAIKKGRL